MLTGNFYLVVLGHLFFKVRFVVKASGIIYTAIADQTRIKKFLKIS